MASMKRRSVLTYMSALFQLGDGALADLQRLRQLVLRQAQGTPDAGKVHLFGQTPRLGLGRSRQHDLGWHVGNLDNTLVPWRVARMKAELLLRERHGVAEDAFVELRIWRVPLPVRGSGHAYKYTLPMLCGANACFAMTTRRAKATTSIWTESRCLIGSARRKPCWPISGMMSIAGKPNEHGDAFRRLA